MHELANGHHPHSYVLLFLCLDSENIQTMWE